MSAANNQSDQSSSDNNILSRFWWVSVSSPFWLDKWVLSLSSFIYLFVSFYAAPYFSKESLIPSSGAVIALAGFLLTIKHSQLFHRKDLSLKQKFDAANSSLMMSSVQFPVKDQLMIKNVMLDEKVSVVLMVTGTLIWAYM